MSNIFAFAGFILFIVLFGMAEDYGDEQRKRECAIASNAKQLPKLPW